MKSKWFEYKEKARKFRRDGRSIRSIERRLKIPRSTLSGWFKDIRLTKEQKHKLTEAGRFALIKARLKASIWHKNQKKKRLVEADLAAQSVLAKFDTSDNNTLELALAMLYLGEGDKTN